MEDTEEYADGSIGLLSAAEKYDPNSKIHFSTYDYQCIDNAILSNLRKKQSKKRSSGPMQSLEDIEVAQPEPAFVGERENAVASILKNTVDDTEEDRFNRDILKRYFLEGMSLRQIAEQLGITIAKVLSAKQAALTLIRKRFSINGDTNLTEFLNGFSDGTEPDRSRLPQWIDIASDEAD